MAKLHNLGQHRDGVVRGESGRVQSELAVAAFPVAAHLAACIENKRAVEDQYGRMNCLASRQAGISKVARCVTA